MGKSIIKLTYRNKNKTNGQVIDDVKMKFCNVILDFKSDKI